MSGLIWLQTVKHLHGCPERILEIINIGVKDLLGDKIIMQNTSMQRV